MAIGAFMAANEEKRELMQAARYEVVVNLDDGTFQDGRQWYAKQKREIEQEQATCVRFEVGNVGEEAGKWPKLDRAADLPLSSSARLDTRDLGSRIQPTR